MTTKSKTTGETAANGGRDRWNGAPSYETIAAEGRENFDSFVEASTIATKGYGAISDAWFAFAKGAMEAHVEASKALMGARSWTELTDAQAGHAKTSFERTVTAGNRIVEMSVKTAGDAVEPIRARAETLVERYAKPAL